MMSNNVKKEKNTPPPIDIDKVNDLYEELDVVLDKHIKDYELNFMEIDTALMLIKKKMSYEETSSWLQFMISTAQENQEDQTPKDPKGDMYG